MGRRIPVRVRYRNVSRHIHAKEQLQYDGRSLVLGEASEGAKLHDGKVIADRLVLQNLTDIACVVGYAALNRSIKGSSGKSSDRFAASFGMLGYVS